MIYYYLYSLDSMADMISYFSPIKNSLENLELHFKQRNYNSFEYLEVKDWVKEFQNLTKFCLIVW